jgi:hypothetical protein
MIELLIKRLAELNNLIGVEGDFLLPAEQVELTGIEEILAEESVTS